MNKIDELIKMLKEVDNIVVFTGAGVSTDSGLKDFRSKDGLYSKKYDYSAEYMLSHTCFMREPELFYKYYKDNFNCLDVKPNKMHLFLKELEDIGKLKCIVTQNIDGLHTKAGSKKVYEIHGTIYKNYCLKCGREYKPEYVFKSHDIPLCLCGSIIKPKVVLYEESLPEYELDESIKAIDKCEMLIIMGSSLTVYPAASLVNYFHGKYLVIINNDKTPYDKKASLVINDNLAKIATTLSKSLSQDSVK